MATINAFDNQVLAANVTFNGGTFNAGSDATDNDINIGTNASAGRIVTVGNTVSNSQVNVNAGGGSLFLTTTNTGGLTASIDGSFDISTSTGTGSINAASTMNIANQNVNANVNIGTAGTRTITIGSTASTSAVAINCGTGGVSVGTSANAHTTTVGSSNSTSTTTIACGTGGCNVGTSANNHTTTVGTTNGTATTVVQAGAGGITLTGVVTSANAMSITSGDMTLTSGNLILPTTSSTVGQIVQNGNRIFHTFGTGNLFIGTSAGNFTTTGTFNCGVGPTSSSPVMASLTSGSQNTSLGLQTLNACTSGNNNVAIGFNTSLRITTGGDNVVVGQAALAQVTTGSFNVSLGSSAGGGYTVADSSNISIGYNVGGTAGQSNVLIIGSGTGTGDGNVNVATICGISGKTSTSGVAVLVNTSNVLGTTTSSIRFKENVHDMGDQSSDIFKLRPVTFTYKVSKPHVDEETSKLRQFGLIAEEVEQVMPDQVTYNLDGNIESVRYLNFIPMLINEIQKLRKEVEELKRR